jgi:hypothetical protein
MEPKIFNREILLFTGSSFCSRQFYDRNDENEGSNRSTMEEFEKACWDGMLYEILPELFIDPMQHGESYIWNTASGVNFLCVNMSAYPITAENQTSIDPYFFLHATDKAN